MPKEIWISANAAAEIISANSGRPIIPQYIRDLAQKGKIASRAADGRTNEYLRSDVDKIKVKPHGKNKPASPIQNELPIAHEVASLSVEEKTINATNVPTSIVEPNRDIPVGLPNGAMKKKVFAETYGINDPNLSTWMKNGLGDDRLEFSQYINEKNRLSYCFTPEQRAHNLEVLRKHGKISDSGSAE